jgi:hypothetical protein
VAARKESTTKATEHPISDTAAAATVTDTTDESANSEAVTNALAKVIQEPVNNATSAGLPSNSDPFGKPINNSATAKTSMEMTAMSANKHSNDATAPHTAGEDAPRSKLGIKDCVETTADSLPMNKHTDVKRLVLNELGNSLEDVLEALKTQNTDCIADSAVLGKYAVLSNTDPIVFARIVTGIGMKCVDSNLKILASALEIEKERLQEYEQN